jgi:hypothetical protein
LRRICGCAVGSLELWWCLYILLALYSSGPRIASEHTGLLTISLTAAGSGSTPFFLSSLYFAARCSISSSDSFTLARFCSGAAPFAYSPRTGLPVTRARSCSSAKCACVTCWLCWSMISAGTPSMPKISISRPWRPGLAFSTCVRFSLWTWFMCTERPGSC